MLVKNEIACSVELGSGAIRTVDLKLVGSVRERMHKQSSPWSQSSYSSSPSRPSSASSSFSSSSPLSRTFGSYMLEIAQRQLLHIIVFPLCLMPKRQRALAAEQPGVATIKFRSSENYMSGLCWQVIRSDVAVDNSKLFCMASHMTKLGMTAQSLDETSIAEAVCLALFQSPDASLYDATRTLKDWLGFASERFADSIPGVARPTEYPADIDEFKLACPEWYEFAYGFSAHKPCPIDFACLKAIKERATACAEVRPAKRLCPAVRLLP